MKLEKEEYYIEKSKGLEEYKFKLPEDRVGVQLIVDLLISRLYVDKEISSIREIYTNAIDANIEAGSTRPVDITCPTLEDPFVSFRDYGLGMSPKQMVQTYINLGASTKRETNSLHGGFGIGSISPFTITSQIEVTTIHQNIKYSWIVYRNENGIPALSLLNKKETEESNGTLVKFKVPVIELYKINCFISLLHTVALKKSNLKRECPKNEEFRKGLIIQETEDYMIIFPKNHTKLLNVSYKTMIAVTVGDIPYSINIEDHNLDGPILPTLISSQTWGWTLFSPHRLFFDELEDHYCVFLKAPIGELTLTSSREELMNDKKLKDWLIPTLNRVVDKAYKSLCKRVEETKDTIEKIENAFNNFPFLLYLNDGKKTYNLDTVKAGDYFSYKETRLFYLYNFQETNVTLVYEDKEDKVTKDDISNLLNLPYRNKKYTDIPIETTELNKDLRVVDTSLIYGDMLDGNLNTFNISTLLKADIVLAKSSYPLKSILRNFKFSDKFTLVFRVRSDIFESYLQGLSNIKDLTENFGFKASPF